MKSTPYTLPADFGRRLSKAREHAGYTQAGLAELAGVHRTTINRWEMGHRTPSKLALEALCKALGMGWLTHSGQTDE